MLWIKALHIIFMVTWFAGLFYLPRLFVYYTEADQQAARTTLLTMQRKLLIMTHIGGGLTLVFGMIMLFSWPAYMSMGWMHAKLALVLVLLVFHGWLTVHVVALRGGKQPLGTRAYRWINEFPVLILVPVVILVVVKPVLG